MTKRSVILGSLLVVIFLAIAVTVLFAIWPGPYERHFKNSLPPNTRLINFIRKPGGFDVSYGFLFEISDDALLNQLIDDWGLIPSVKDDQETMSFVALSPPTWWPNQAQLEQMPIQYERVDWNNEQYWSVWLDRKNGRLFAEYGNW